MQSEPYDKLMDDYGCNIYDMAEGIIMLLRGLGWDKYITLTEVENWLLSKIPKPLSSKEEGMEQ